MNTQDVFGIEYLVQGAFVTGEMLQRVYFHQAPVVSLPFTQVHVPCATMPIFPGCRSVEAAQKVLDTIVCFHTVEYFDFSKDEKPRKYDIIFDVFGLSPKRELDLKSLCVVRLDKRISWTEEVVVKGVEA